MSNLTAEELKFLNFVSEQVNSNVHLGSLLNGHLGAGGTPVNAVKATKDLTFTGVVKDSETMTVNNPAVGGSDVYEFLSDVAQSKTAAGNIAVNITANTVKATVNLTVAVQPISGDTMTLGTKTYIFVPPGTDNADGEISVGSALGNAQTNIVAAINGTDDHNVAHPLVSAAAFAANVSAVTAFVGGTVGNSIASTETFTSGSNLFSGVTLGSGADCSAANAITALVAAVTASDTQGVGATDEAGDVLRLTADAGGVAGNAVIIGETLSNATFAAGATLLSGGVDGSVGFVGQVLVDATYLYVAVADNTIADSNWRRISVGSVY